MTVGRWPRHKHYNRRVRGKPGHLENHFVRVGLGEGRIRCPICGFEFYGSNKQEATQCSGCKTRFEIDVVATVIDD